ncbi:hypothetical protein HRbin06_00102 [archaeon HR06]|nr:hypothetical protein HRbin06_00102 [archaeon HR06]
MRKNLEKFGQMLVDTHLLWDLEAFGREVRRRKVLERIYKKFYKVRNRKGVDLAFDPEEIMAFIYSRAADNYPLY